MTLGEWLGLLAISGVLLLLFYLFLVMLIRNIIASYYYCKFTYAAYITSLHSQSSPQFDYDDCLSVASSLYNKLTAPLTIRNFLTKIIAFVHKRRHPEDYI